MLDKTNPYTAQPWRPYTRSTITNIAQRLEQFVASQLHAYSFITRPKQLRCREVGDSFFSLPESTLSNDNLLHRRRVMQSKLSSDAAALDHRIRQYKT